MFSWWRHGFLDVKWYCCLNSYLKKISGWIVLREIDFIWKKLLIDLLDCYFCNQRLVAWIQICASWIITKRKNYLIPRKLTANKLSTVSRNMFVLVFHAYNDQGRNEVGWRPGQEASLAPRVRTWGLSEANLLLKSVLVTLLGFFCVPIMIRRPGNCAPLAPLVTPLTTTAVHFTLYFVPFIETMLVTILWMLV